MPSSLSTFEMNSPLRKNEEKSVAESEDPLSNAQIFTHDSNDIDNLVNSNMLHSSLINDSLEISDIYYEHGEAEDGEEDEDEDSMSFELYQGKLAREQIISQFQKDKDINMSEFMMKYYKYRDLLDMSNGLNELIDGIDSNLIELVNENYLSFINLGKSIDGSLDLIHDVKIDLGDYLKNLKLSNSSIDSDIDLIEKFKDSRTRLINLKLIVKKLIVLSEMVEYFDRLCCKFDENEKSYDMLKELIGLYFGVNEMFHNLFKHVNEVRLEKLINNGILLNLNKKMNGLKMEFKSLLKNYLGQLKDLKEGNNMETFEIFRLYKLLNSGEEKFD